MPSVRLLIQITNHLEDIAHNRLPVIQKRTGFEADKWELMVAD